MLAAALLLGSGSVTADRVQQNRKQLEDLRSRIEELQKSLDDDRGQRDKLYKQLEDAERRVASLSTEAAGLRKRIKRQESRLRKTAEEQEEAREVLNLHREVLAVQVRAAYIIGRSGQARLLLNQEGSQRLSRVLTYYDYLNRARTERIGSIQDQVDALDALAAQLATETQQLKDTRSKHLGAMTALEATRIERAGMVRKVIDRISSGEGELESLRDAEKKLSGLMKQLRSALADVPVTLSGTPLRKLKGKLEWPVRGKLLARYGEPKAGGRLKWNGLWIANDEGNPVRSIARGRVAYVGWMHRYGLIVVLEHEGGYYSLYGHNQNVAVSVGDWVQDGDEIASVGYSGGYDRPGLYFELRKGTKVIDPRPWLKS